ncbi:ATP-binding protein [Alishewanella sp. HH-ZS]|uniref:sensor histidine kinase n=1 Tax=Alishewanella sp. HH-ZS TaxID=1856684 RepID=UPI0008235CE5|nr:ATP-binding protein [Alishewanella sp. HH-ZS]OCW93194.1 hypothetical protein A9165_15735 [Alishewanella sp. HH-ZS]
MPSRLKTPLSLLLLLLLFTLLSYQLLFNRLLSQAQQTALRHGAEFNLYIEQQLARFSLLNQSLAARPELKQALSAAVDSDKSALSQLLADFNLASGSASIYLMDHSGLVLASSNFAQEVSFLDYNFGFRPYFTETIRTGQSYIDYGLGWISKERGIYFSNLVQQQPGERYGVLTSKLNIDQLELAYQSIAGQSPWLFMLVDEENTVLASNNPAWRLSQLGEQSLTLPRHPGMLLPALAVKQQGSLWQLLQQPGQSQLPRTEYTVAQKAHQALPWQLVMLHPTRPLKIQALQYSISLALLLTLLLLTAQYWRNRRQQQLQRTQLYQKLEQAVAERTASLQQSNQQLQLEIRQRSEAEQELRQTQEQLLQAAKLATIGQLSASINHELNQPLTAMHSYLQNSQLLLARGQHTELAGNLDKLSQLLLRLNHIVQQFKGFSRKAANTPRVVTLQSLVNNALDLLQPLLRQQAVSISFEEQAAPHVKVDPLQLEQVLVNLLGNAVQACEGLPQCQLSIRLSVQEQQACLQIHDNGPGIQPHVMVHLFEPFFTTKQGSGLGLGLSISRQIVQSYHGSLQIANHPDGGAVVTLFLPLYRTE